MAEKAKKGQWLEFNIPVARRVFLVRVKRFHLKADGMLFTRPFYFLFKKDIQ